MSHVKQVTITDDQRAYIEAFCAVIRTGLNLADFEDRRKIIELMDIRGTVAFETFLFLF